ncbi:hypothetical protein [Gordonia shandongensis]|uniref:hypothetical protein n=1 Tax=Gordonia shandongensis TaxID=376351 RepID=UPI0004294DDE|nr:hypothetical protein [Gordonia shandongensis]
MLSRRRPFSTLSLIIGTAVAAVAAPLAVPAESAAGPAACPTQYLYLHDMAGTAAEMSSFARRIGTPAACSVVVDYGRTPLTDTVVRAGGPPAAGFTAIDASARQVADRMRLRQHSGATWTVIAHGAGSLVAQRVVQQTGDARRLNPVTDLIAIGPLWRGTNIGFLGDTEDLSRRLGTYDAVLRMEKPLIDPWCAGCRELVRGSDLLVALRRAGLPSPELRYTNVISPIDGLVSDPLSAAIEGMDNRILDPARTRRPAHHFALLSEPAVATIVRDAVGGSTQR